MKNIAFVLSTLLATASAGNICVAGNYKASKLDINRVRVFAAGSPCNDSKTTTLSPEVQNLCDHLPQGIRICGADANLVKIDHGPKAYPGCQIGLEVDGRVYEGETYKYNPDDGNARCGLTGIDGFLQFVGAPMCGRRASRST